MENIDYKIALLEVISMIKDKATYLKMIDVNDETVYNPQLFEGMALAYHFVMDGIKSHIECSNMDLADFGLEDYDPSEILSYKPLNYEG